MITTTFDYYGFNLEIKIIINKCDFDKTKEIKEKGNT